MRMLLPEQAEWLLSDHDNDDRFQFTSWPLSLILTARESMAHVMCSSHCPLLLYSQLCDAGFRTSICNRISFQLVKNSDSPA